MTHHSCLRDISLHMITPTKRAREDLNFKEFFKKQDVKDLETSFILNVKIDLFEGQREREQREGQKEKEILSSSCPAEF